PCALRLDRERVADSTGGARHQGDVPRRWIAVSAARCSRICHTEPLDFIVPRSHAMSSAKILVAQGGGPTAVINQSLAGVVLEARKANYALRCVHIPKTIDNDLVGNDHTPGFPSAARFVAQAFAGANLDNAALPGVYVGVVMGRHAGFLTAAAALGRIQADDGPHLIYLPERTFEMARFLA